MSPRPSACPQLLAVADLPDRRAALELRGPVGDRLGLEHQVVRAGLDGHPDALAARGAQHRHGVGAGQVQQVHRRPGVPGRLDQVRDRDVLRAARPGGEEVGVVPSVRRRSPLDRGRVLRVDDHLRPVGGQHAQVLLELLGRQRRELLHAGVGHEALEPEDAGVVQPAQVVDVARDRAAPEADVDVRGVLRGLPLDLQPVDGGGRRDAVERHVEDRRDAARRRGAGGRREALPLGAARLVDVHVAVDEAGQQHLVVGQVDGLGALEPRLERLDRDHDPVADGDAAGHLTGAGDHPPAAEDQVEVGHGSARPRLAR